MLNFNTQIIHFPSPASFDPTFLKFPLKQVELCLTKQFPKPFSPIQFYSRSQRYVLRRCYCNAVTRGHMITGQDGGHDGGFVLPASVRGRFDPLQASLTIEFVLACLSRHLVRVASSTFTYKHWRGSNCLIWPLDDLILRLYPPSSAT